MKILLKHLRDACDKEGNVEKRIQHECVKCLKAFMNNKVMIFVFVDFEILNVTFLGEWVNASIQNTVTISSIKEENEVDWEGEWDLDVDCENICFSSLFAAQDISPGGTSATQRQKFHTDGANQCLHNTSGSHGVPNINFSNFMCPLVDFGKVLCSSAKEP